jgi:hypothetical protein
MTYKIREHLDHVYQLEVATYRKNLDENEPLDSVTVECTKCGEVVEELYNADAVEEPPLDVRLDLCADCKGTGSDTSKYPISGCQACDGDGRVTNPWENNEVQFARLLCEIVAALDEGQVKDLIIDVCRSTDLGPDDINQLFDRAEKVWEKAKR